MPGPTSRFWLTCRSATFALVTAYVSALGHLLGNGSPPGIGTLLFTAALVGGTVSGLARVRRGTMQLLGMVIVAQLAYHLLFSLDAHAMSPVDPVRMLVFHAVAAVLCAVVLARGDQALFRLFEALHRVTYRLLARPAGPPATGRQVVVIEPDTDPLSHRLRSTAPRRGPPPARINFACADEVVTPVPAVTDRPKLILAAQAG